MVKGGDYHLKLCFPCISYGAQRGDQVKNPEIIFANSVDALSTDCISLCAYAVLSKGHPTHNLTRMHREPCT